MTLTPRRWFQFHLATAVVVMIAAGGILALELKLQRVEKSVRYDGQPAHYEEENLGYPDVYWEKWVLRFEFGTVIAGKTSFSPEALFHNCWLMVVVLIGVALVSEFYLRRSAARARGPAT